MALIDIIFGHNIVVYDLEIENVIDGKNITWDTHEKMGISVGCLFDYRDGDYKVYLRDGLMDLTRRLNEADLVVAFNQINFDNRLLRAMGYPLLPDIGPSPSEHLHNYDMLAESRAALGWKPGQPWLTGLKLDNHLAANFGQKYLKSANGEEAPKMYQRGQLSNLISYCLADVRRERMLFEKAWISGEYVAGQHGLVKLNKPQDAMRKRES